MKKLLILIMVITLIGCSQTDIEGTWLVEDSDVSLVFTKDTVNFFGVEGTYEIDSTLILDIGTIIEYEYELANNTLVLYADGLPLRLKRVE